MSRTPPCLAFPDQAMCPFFQGRQSRGVKFGIAEAHTGGPGLQVVPAAGAAILGAVELRRNVLRLQRASEMPIFGAAVCLFGEPSLHML